MNTRKKLLIIILIGIILASAVFVFINNSQAWETGTWKLQENQRRGTNNYIYKIEDDNSDTIDIIYDYDGGGNYDYYCINGGQPFSDPGTFILGKGTGTYNYMLPNTLSLSVTEEQNLIKSRFGSVNNYKAFKWLVQNMYVETGDQTTEKVILNNLEELTGVDYSNIDKELLKVMNQLLLWNFVNNVEPEYKNMITKKGITNSLQVYSGNSSVDVSAHNEVLSKYYATLNTIANGISIDGTIDNGIIVDSTFYSNTGGWSSLTINISSPEVQHTEGTKTYKLGPYKMTGNIPSDYIDTITINTTTNDVFTNAKVVDVNGKEIQPTIGQEYYIVVTTNAELTQSQTYSHSATIKYKPIITSITAKTYFKDSWENSSKQHVIEIGKTGKNGEYGDGVSTYIEVETTEEPEYTDLVLTKEIISIDGTTYNDDNYVVSIQNSSIESKDFTYSSIKKAAEVKPGSEVVYRLTVYNESDVNGYVSEIKDYLPSGLEYNKCEISKESEINIGNNKIINYKGGASVSANVDVNKIVTFSIKKSNQNPGQILNAYDGTTMEAFYIDIYCKVSTTATDDTILTNKAEISKYAACGEDGYKETSHEENHRNYSVDRDSFAHTTLTSIKTHMDHLSNVKGVNTYLTNVDNGSITQKVDKNTYDVQDDDDFARIKVVVPTIDVGLKKSIIGFESDGRSTEEDSRLCSITTDGPQNEKYVVDYQMYKTVYSQDFAAGDKIKYAIDIYNEGEIDASAYEIIDYLPEGLKLTGVKLSGADEENFKSYTNEQEYEEDTTSNCYYYDTTNNIVYIKLGNTNLIPAFTGENAKSDKLKENRVRIITECSITADAPTEVELINVAEISKYITNPNTYVETKNGTESSDENGLIDTDIDSGSATLEQTIEGDTEGDTNLKSYLEDIAVPQENSESEPKTRTAQEPEDEKQIDEDDQDYEVIMLKPSFDLALRKFITKIGNTEITDRESDKYWTTGYAAQLLKSTTISYSNHKNPLVAQIGDTVTYTIRVYNEGYIDGYASEIVDYLPQGLEFKENSSINDQYGWVATKNENGTTTVTTEYLAPVENDEINKTQKRLGATGAKGIAKMVSGIAAILGDISLEEKYQQYLSDKGKSSYYRDVQIECVITEDMYNVEKDGLENYLINVAEITKYGYYDEQNQFVEANVENVDIDSEQNNVFGSEAISSDVIKDHVDNLIETKLNIGDIEQITQLHVIPGLQDDDDFEIVYVPEPLDLNLQLVKVDSEDSENKINGVKFKIDETEYTTGTKDGNKGIIQIGSEIKKAGTYVYKISETSIENTEILEKLKYDLMLTVQVELDEVTREFKVTKITLNEVVNGEPIGNTLDIVTNLINNTAQVQLQLTDGKFVLAKAKYNKQTGTIELVIPNRIKQFDLALQKFITELGREEVSEENENVTQQSTNNTSQEIQSNETQNNETEKTKINYTKITNREPKFSIDEQGNYVYKPTAEELGALEVINGDIVVYTIRIYNEGDLDGYAERIMDDIPENLEFLPQNEINAQYKWKMLRQVREDETVTSKDENAGTVVIGEQTLSYIMYNGKMYIVTENVEEAEYVVTNYLSKQNGTDNLIKYFDAENYNAETTEGPDYKDVKIAFKVKEPGANRVIINYAQISEDLPIDRQGNEADLEDKDSTPNIWEESPRDDDQDIEMIRVKEFDLSLKKCVTTAILIDNGKQTVYEGNSNPEEEKEIIKVDIPKSKIDDVIVKFKYKIRVYNEGEIEGFVKEITDYVPQGLRFVASEDINIEYGWTDAGEGKITTDYLKNKLLQPGEYADVEIMFTWINAEDNMSQKTNIAEISEDYNEFGDVPDIDSTPDNFVPGEDDIDTADVLLTPKTGNSIETMYIALALAVVGLISTGTILIKKFVL